MLADLSDAVLQCSVPIEVTRWLPVPVIRGRKQGASVQVVFKIKASVQPMGPKELQRLPEGSRTEGAIVVYAKKQLQTLQTDLGIQPDQIHYNGVDYQVQSVENWFDLGGYYLITATRVQR